MARKTKMVKYRKAYVPRPVKAYVNRAIHANIENKFTVGSLIAVFGSVSSAWTEQDICAPPQGDGISNRSGSQIKIRSVELKGCIAQGSAETATDDYYNALRIVLGFYNAASYTPLTASSATLNVPITTEYYTSGTLRKKFLDKYVALQVASTEQGAGDGYAPSVKTFKYYKKFKRPLTITYGDSGVTKGNGALILSMLSDSAGVPNPGFICGYWKVMFEDA